MKRLDQEKMRYNPTLIKNIGNYFRVSPQLHTLNVIYTGFGMLFGLAAYDSHQLATTAFASTITGLSGTIVASNLLKSINNLRHYNALRKRFSKNGWNEWPVAPRLEWWCDRYVAYRAATDEGYKKEIRDYYRRTNRSWLAIRQSPPKKLGN